MYGILASVIAAISMLGCMAADAIKGATICFCIVLAGIGIFIVSQFYISNVPPKTIATEIKELELINNTKYVDSYGKEYTFLTENGYTTVRQNEVNLYHISVAESPYVEYITSETRCLGSVSASNEINLYIHETDIQYHYVIKQ